MTTSNRRQFLAASAAALAATSPLGRSALGAHHKTVLGHGSHQYRVEAGWGDLGAAKVPVKNCHCRCS